MNRRLDMDEGRATSPPTGALAESSLPARIPIVTQQLSCHQCKYNLRGLPRDRDCPECGFAIEKTLALHQRQLPGRLAGLTLTQQVFALATWPFLEQVLNFLVGFVDTFLAGHLSVAATKAIAVASYIGWLMAILQMSIGIGAAAVIARAIGGKHRRIANAALGQAMLLSLAMGLLSASVIFIIAPWLCAFMELHGESYDIGVSYLRIVAVAAPFSSVLFVGSACLRAAGDTRSPFLVLALVNVVNVAASCAFVYAAPPLGGHGAAGIAAGTAVAWLVGCALILVVLIGGWGQIRLRLIRLRLHWHTMKRIVRVASSSLAESLGMWIGNFFVVKMVGIVGLTMTAALGAHVIAVRVEAISYLPCMALGIAASTLTGQYLGLGDPQRARSAAILCWVYGMIVMGAMGLLFWFGADMLVRIITDEPELLESAPDLLRICAPIQIFFATAIVLSNAMRGAGDTKTTMKLTYLSTWCIRIPAAYLLAIHFELGLNGIWMALSGELLIRGCIFATRFFVGGWEKVEV